MFQTGQICEASIFDWKEENNSQKQINNNFLFIPSFKALDVPSANAIGMLC